MRKLLPLALFLLLSASACERVEQSAATAPTPNPQPPTVQELPQPPQIAPLTPLEQQAPVQSAPQPTAPSARDQMLLDMDILADSITSARAGLLTGNADAAKAKLQSAQAGLAFIEASLPSANVPELIQRSLFLAAGGKVDQAVAALKEASSLVPHIAGLNNPQDISKALDDAAAALSKGDIKAAQEALAAVPPKLEGSTQQALLGRLKDYLRGGQNAVNRNAPSVADVELAEAGKCLGQLRALTEAAWPAAGT